MFDTIIIGAGPAGLTAAIYLLRANKKVLVLEKEGIGGQMASSPLIENYPGFKKAPGTDIANAMYEQVIDLGGNIEIEEVLSIKKGEVVTDSNTYKTKSVIIATGAKPRRLGLPNEEELIGNGVSFCVACDGAFYKGEDVAVIGGGNSAVINALSLSNICNHVYVIQNLASLTASAKDSEDLLNKKNATVYYNAKLTKYLGTDHVNGIEIEDDKGTHEIKVSGVFVSIGLIPSTEIFNNVDLDKGYINSNDCKTNIDGIFVAGDCRTKNVRQITTATADGTIAALLTIDYLNK